MPYDIGAMPMMTAAQALAVYDAAQTMPDRAKAADALAFALREAIASKPRKKAATAAPAASAGEPAALNAKALSAALAAVCGVIERRVSSPILTHVLLHAKAGVLTLSGTNLDQFSSVELRDQSGTLPDFVTTVPAHDLAAALKGANDPIGFELDGDKLAVTIAGSTVRLATLPAGDFPLPIGYDEESFALAMARAETFRDGLGFVEHAISKEETRYYLNGAALLHEVRDGQPVMTFVATDGHRLACQEASRLAWEGPDPTRNTYIIPHQAVAWFLKHAPKTGDMTVEISGRLIRFTFENGTFTTKLIDGSFPDFRRVIPEKRGQHGMKVSDPKVFAATIKRVASVIRDKQRSVKLDISDALTIGATVKATCRNMDGGKAEAEIPGTTQDGVPVDVGFNAAYLQDIAAEAKAGFELRFPDRSSASKITFPDRPDRVAVLMPLRV